MPIKLGTNKIALPYSKAYLGSNLVYQKKQPIFVAVGNKVAYSSTDGINWTAMTFPGVSSTYLPNLYDVTFGNNRFVAVGPSGSTYYSKDGKTWTAGTDLGNVTINAIAYNGTNRFVAVGSGGNYRVYYSTAGSSWTKGGGLSTSYKYYTVAYGAGKFIAGGEREYYSEDGISWTLLSSHSGYTFRGMTYANNMFVATCSDGIRYSTTGLDWTFANGATSSTSEVAYGNNKFIAIGAGNYSSTDGINWTSIDVPTANDIVFGDNKFVIVGGGVTSGGTAYSSTDGINWTAMNGLSTYCSAVAYGEI